MFGLTSTRPRSSPAARSARPPIGGARARRGDGGRRGRRLCAWRAPTTQRLPHAAVMLANRHTGRSQAAPMAMTSEPRSRGHGGSPALHTANSPGGRRGAAGPVELDRAARAPRPLTRFAPPLLQVGMPGGIMHVQDNLAAGPKNLIIDPTVDSNPASTNPCGNNPDQPYSAARGDRCRTRSPPLPRPRQLGQLARSPGTVFRTLLETHERIR
jgi:hypothetical protein